VSIVVIGDHVYNASQAWNTGQFHQILARRQPYREWDSTAKPYSISQYLNEWHLSIPVPSWFSPSVCACRSQKTWSVES
jgi:hypothetical protein